MSPLEKIIATSKERVEEFLNEVHENGAHGDSPIEKYLFTALFANIQYTPTEFRGLGVIRPDSKFTRDTQWLYVTPQYKHGNYRIDFLVEVFDGRTWIPLAVECDGHDFHERTKEQAKRDRKRDRTMLMDDLTVFRFTGSEIYRDPFGCAEQIVDWAHKYVWRHL